MLITVLQPKYLHDKKNHRYTDKAAHILTTVYTERRREILNRASLLAQCTRRDNYVVASLSRGVSFSAVKQNVVW